MLSDLHLVLSAVDSSLLTGHLVVGDADTGSVHSLTYDKLECCVMKLGRFE